jgi:hypothetical protein
VTRCILEKIAQNVAQPDICQNGNKYPKNFQIFQKKLTHSKRSHPAGKKSPNLVTLGETISFSAKELKNGNQL